MSSPGGCRCTGSASSDSFSQHTTLHEVMSLMYVMRDIHQQHVPQLLMPILPLSLRPSISLLFLGKIHGAEHSQSAIFQQ